MIMAVRRGLLRDLLLQSRRRSRDLRSCRESLPPRYRSVDVRLRKRSASRGRAAREFIAFIHAEYIRYRILIDKTKP